MYDYNSRKNNTKDLMLDRINDRRESGYGGTSIKEVIDDIAAHTVYPSLEINYRPEDFEGTDLSSTILDDCDFLEILSFCRHSSPCDDDQSTELADGITHALFA